MPFMKYDNIRVAGLAAAVPSHSQDIDMKPDRDDAAYVKSFVKNVGVTKRHISIIEQTSLDLCYAASLKAMEKAGWSGEDIDGVIFLTQTPDYATPGNSALLQKLLGMRTDTIAFDINLGCSAPPYGIFTACSLMQNEGINKMIVATSDTQWPGYKTKDKLLADNTFLFGEGGSVVLLEKQAGSPEIKIELWNDGSGYKYLHALGGARNSRDILKNWNIIDEDVIVPTGEQVSVDTAVYLDGPSIMSFTITTVVDAMKSFCNRIVTDVSSYDGVVLHQANLKILKTMAKRLNLDLEKMPVTIDRYANTSAASVFLTMADAYADSEKESVHLLASGFGVGLSWGVMDLHISPSVIAPIFETDFVFEEGKFKRE